MLRIISLHTLKQIFETEVRVSLSPMAQMTYINCLMYWFDGMPLDLESANAFDIVKAQMKSYPANEKYFKEMETAGIVQINSETITFFNYWRKHIDKDLLNKPSPEQYLQRSEEKPAREYLSELLVNRSLFDLVGMRHKFPEDKIKELIKEFVQEQDVTKKKYFNPDRCAEHCIRWINKKAPHVPKGTGAGNGKILGR